MIVTLTSKGQLTLPKAIRERLQLDAGSKLDFSWQDDGTLTVRPMRSVSSLLGLVRRPRGIPPSSLQELKDARADHVAAKFERVRRAGSPAGAGPKAVANGGAKAGARSVVKSATKS